jgi:hypothetical protein
MFGNHVSHRNLKSPKELGTRLKGWYDARTGALADGARSFVTASSQLLSIADNASLSCADVDFCLGGWVRMTSVATAQVIISKWDFNASQREYMAWYNPGTSRFEFLISQNGTSIAATATANTLGAPSINTWYFVLAYHDATANTIGISVNGGAFDTTSISGGARDGTSVFSVGGRSTTPADSFLGGTLDSLFFAKPSSIGSLTSTIASRLYNSGSGLCYPQLSEAEKTSWGLVSFWCMNEETGTAFDAHGTNHLTASASSPTFAAGIAAGDATDGNFAATFGGTNDFLSVADNSTLDTGGASWSFAAWVNPTASGTFTVLASKLGANPNLSWLIARENASNFLQLWSSTNGTSAVTNRSTGNVAVLAGNWYLVVCVNTVSAGNTTTQFSVNGSTLAGSAQWTGTVFDNAASFILGARGDTGSQRWNGRMDGAALWNGRALSQSDITELLNAGRGLKYVGLSSNLRTTLTSFWNLDEDASATRIDSHGTNNLSNNGAVGRGQGVAYYEGAVSKWLDGSVSQSHVVQATVAARPTRSRFGQNGGWVVNFDGTDDMLAALATTQFTHAYISYFHSGATFTAQRGILTGTGAGATEIVAVGTNGAATLVTGSTSITGAKRERAFASATTPTVTLNRMAVLRVSGGFPSLTAQIGKDRTSAGTFWPGQIASIVLVDRPTPVEDAQIMDLLMAESRVAA